MGQDKSTAMLVSPTGSRWLTAFLFLTGALASTILLKVVVVQYLEILYFIELVFLLTVFCENEYKIAWFRPYYRIACWYLVFSFVAFSMSVYALRYDFYFPDHLGWLNYPVVITISRIIELFASVSIMLYLAHIFRKDFRKIAFTMRVYFWVGVVSAIYSFVSYPISVANIADLGSYGSTHRLRGFYNEGGPYGLYVVSVFLVGVALYKRGWIKGNIAKLSFAILSVAFLGSQSKAAFCAVLIAFIVNGLLAKSFARRFVLASAMIIVLFSIYQVIDLGAALRAYRRGSEAYEWLSYRHANDGNFVQGRVAGAFLVPRMISEHPLAGVGWGNYGLVRNAPEYREAAVFTRANDDPGLGLVGMAAELGLPLTFYLCACLLLPFVYLQRIKAPIYVTNLALVQPLVHVFGGQLNLTYPWVVTSFALGLGYSLTRSAALPNVS